MNFEPIINALELPNGARVDQRVPKKLLLEHGAPTAADKKQIQDGVEELFWIAALKPTNIGVPIFRDQTREYLEIIVLAATLRTSKKTRLIELIHRAIPYPVFLIAGLGDSAMVCLAHKRWSQGEHGAVVAEDIRRTAPFNPETPDALARSFLSGLTLSGLPTGDMFALYQGWIDRIAALEAATISGDFQPPATAEASAALREGLDQHARLQSKIIALRSQATKEKQLNRRVALNLEIKRLEAKLAATAKTL